MKFFLWGLVFTMVLSTLCLAAETTLPSFPGPEPGAASAAVSGAAITLSNTVIEARWEIADGRFRFAAVTDRLSGASPVPGMPFAVELASGTVVNADRMVVTEGPVIEELKPAPGTAVYSKSIGGKAVRVVLRDRETGLVVVWRGILRNGSNYIRQEVTFSSSKPGVQLADMVMLDIRVPEMGLTISGNVQGSPAVTRTMFFAIEHPMSVSLITEGDSSRLTCGYERNVALDGGVTMVLSSVIGVVPAGQMRRGFLYYLERERAHPYRQYVHYNSWYDLNSGRSDRRLAEPEVITVIDAIGTELVKKRGVTLNGYVIDDGWDSQERVWEFHDGFPNGFTTISEAAQSYGAGIGVWMSPWGGYGRAKRSRLENGVKAGFETNSEGFSMAGKNYGAHFKNTAAKMMRTYGVNYFKFDGMGGGVFTTFVQKELEGDINAILDMVLWLREINPKIFINATVGTWPSPFWTRYVDSIWRQGADTSVAGVGNSREQWITYRDKFTYERIVKGCSLYPLNSLMFHGLVIRSRSRQGNEPIDEQSVTHEIRAAFGCGSDLQELYISHQLLTEKMWDDLAESAKWYEKNANVFADTHWLGGNPDSLRVYGWAAWTPRKAILTLRNPDTEPHEFAFDVSGAFELPEGAPRRYALKSPYADQRIQTADIQADSPYTFRLEPFEVLTFEALPVR